jgi:class 3 adenylate cyclase
MQCSRCGEKNPPRAKFCVECGTPFAAAASPQAYTPRHLAERILTSRSALEGERKLVTVLFADLKGSMELLADRDPEEARKLLDPIVEHMMEAVHRYEGTVNQVMGDGIMALFGAPLAHEDHALRACYAALRMQERVKAHAAGLAATGVSVQIRVGLNSGEVVVRSIGSDLRMDYTAVGQTTHLAARMEQTATPGAIRLTAQTLGLVQDLVRVAPLGPTEVKGLSRPVDVYELEGVTAARSRLDAAAARGLTRFVGREGDLDVLRRALGPAAEGRGQLVAVVGSAGVGKSRLVRELTRSAAARDWRVLEAGAVSYGAQSSYLPVVELLRRYFQIEPRDDERAIGEAVTAGLRALGGGLMEAVRPALLTLLDVTVDDAGWAGLDPPQRRRQTHVAVERFLLQVSQAQPLLLVVEDLHWVDAETWAVLDALVERVPAARMVLIVTFRPEFTHGWGGRVGFQQMGLDVLEAASADALLDALLGADPGLRELKRLLIERTEGNPFFLEEAVRALVETGLLAGEKGGYRVTGPVRSLPLPATAQSVLAARIDRLAPEDKRLLQAAAVVGSDVSLPLLQAIADDADEDGVRAGLARLQAAQFLYEAQIFPELEYRFAHALTHDVAYGTVLADRRVTLHAALVPAHERLHADRLAEHVERLAHHASRGQLWDQAVRYGYAAGQRCIGLSAYHAAAAYLDDALAAAERLPDDQRPPRAIDIRLRMRVALLAIGETFRAFGLLVEAEQLAVQIGDRARIAMVTSRLMHMLWIVGQTEQAREYAKRSIEHAEAIDDIVAAISLHYSVGTAASYWGDYVSAERHARRMLELLAGDDRAARGDGLMFPSVGARVLLSIAYGEQGRFTEALATGAEAARLAETLRHPFGVAQAQAFSAYYHLQRGDHVAAAELCERSLAMGEESATVALVTPYLRAFLACTRIQAGELEDGVLALRAAVEAQEALTVRAGLSLLIGLLAEALLVAGRLEEARAEAQRGLEVATACGERRMEATFGYLLGDVAARRSPPAIELAESSYLHALGVATELGARPSAAHCHLGLGRLFGRTGAKDRAREHLTTAAAMYREMDMALWLDQALAAMP